MNIRFVCVGILGLSACVLEPRPPGTAPELEEGVLEDFGGNWNIDQDTGETDVRGLVIYLSRVDGGLCGLLPATATVTLDGVPAEIQRGGYYGGDGEWPHNDDGCTTPELRWQKFPTGAISTLIASDGDTTWTVQLEQPFAPRQFVIVSPLIQPLHTGDQVMLELQPTADALLSAHVELRTAGGLLSFGEGSGLEREQGRVRFTMPTISTPEEATLGSVGYATMKVHRCDVPGGCDTLVFLASPDLKVAVSP